MCGEVFTNVLSTAKLAMLTATHSAIPPSTSCHGPSGTAKNPNTRPGNAPTKKRR